MENRFQFENIPSELKSKDQWVGFRIGKTKVPFIANNPSKLADHSTPATWGSFNDAVAGFNKGHFKAIGFAFNNDYIGVDLDKCIIDGKENAFAANILSQLDSYSETSYSGNGIHIILKGNIERSKKTKFIEIYCCKRFFIFTGNRLAKTSATIQSRPEVVKDLLKKDLLEGSECSESLEDLKGLEGFEDLDVVQPSPPLVESTPIPYTIDEVLTMTCPAGIGERHACVLSLARGLKFNMKMAAEDMQILKPIVRQWHTKALPFIGTKEFDASWADFVEAWPSAHTPLGQGVLSSAWERAQHKKPDSIACEYDSLPARLLVGLCQELAKASPLANGVFYLSSYTAGELVGLSQARAFHYLKMLAADDVIEVIQRGNIHKANRYRLKRGAQPAKADEKRISEVATDS